MMLTSTAALKSCPPDNFTHAALMRLQQVPQDAIFQHAPSDLLAWAKWRIGRIGPSLFLKDAARRMHQSAWRPDSQYICNYLWACSVVAVM